jgi:hypothetical protein
MSFQQSKPVRLTAADSEFPEAGIAGTPVYFSHIEQGFPVDREALSVFVRRAPHFFNTEETRKNIFPFISVPPFLRGRQSRKVVTSRIYVKISNAGKLRKEKCPVYSACFSL